MEHWTSPEHSFASNGCVIVIGYADHYSPDFESHPYWEEENVVRDADGVQRFGKFAK